MPLTGQAKKGGITLMNVLSAAVKAGQVRTQRVRSEAVSGGVRHPGQP